MVLAGCAQYGPEAMRGSRLAYNTAVQTSEQRELLLNIVRLRYLDAPEFLAVSGISTQMTVEATASIGGSFGEEGDENTSLVAPGAEIGYSETPTITFTPRRDKAFVRQLVAPVDIDSIYLLTRHGWGIDEVLALVTTRINGVDNRVTGIGSPSSSGAGLVSALAGLRRQEVLGRLRVDVEERRVPVAAPLPAVGPGLKDVLGLQSEGLSVEYLPDPPRYEVFRREQAYTVQIAPAAWQDADFVAAARRLGLSAEAVSIEIDPDTGGGKENNRLRIGTRSVLGAMSYLASGVEVPAPHLVAGVAAAAGIPAEDVWLQVLPSSQTPENAFLAVPYRDHWFYIADNDLASKRTLGLLTALVRLSIYAEGAQNVPVLTLPITR